MTTINVKTTVDISKIDGAAKQLPFALSKAINSVLIKAQTAERTRIRATFTIRRPRFADLSVKITQFAKKTTLVGQIAIAPPGDTADIFAKFEAGGIKRPTKGANLAIPITGSPVKKTLRSVIQAKNRPRALLDQSQNTTSTGKGKVGGAFLRPAKDGKPAGIFIRTKQGLKLAYLLEPEAPIKPELHFVDTVTQTITREWASTFEQELANALRTAR
jgi:hypothetical protein